jgi:poly-gamma-glutamate synthesis protein (capsule biosynthesis protein)
MGRVVAAISAASTTSDLVIVMVHWGIEGSSAPTGLQIRQAHRMVDAGADVIFGSHAHRLHPLEIYRGRPIFFGLGNTVWPRADGASGGIGEVIVRPDGTIEARVLPVELVDDGRPVLAGV